MYGSSCKYLLLCLILAPSFILLLNGFPKAGWDAQKWKEKEKKREWDQKTENYTEFLKIQKIRLFYSSFGSFKISSHWKTCHVSRYLIVISLLALNYYILSLYYKNLNIFFYPFISSYQTFYFFQPATHLSFSLFFCRLFCFFLFIMGVFVFYPNFLFFLNLYLLF